MPHAIGEGILMVEIMEPSDLAVRFEFEKSGYVIPEEARFMKRGLDFCLDVFDYEKRSTKEIIQKYRPEILLVNKYNASSYKESLIDERSTNSFSVCKSTIHGSIEKQEDSFYIGIITQGSCTIKCADEILELKQFDKFFCPQGIDSIFIESTEGVEILESYPPKA